jgi:hypothetical protein
MCSPEKVLIVRGKNMKGILRFIVEFIAGAIFALLLPIFVGIVLWLASTLIAIITSDKIFLRFDVLGYICAFICMPAGSVLGILLVEKFIFKVKRYDVAYIIISFVFSLIGVMLVAGPPGMLVGDINIFAYPFIATCFSVVAYNVGRFVNSLKDRKENKGSGENKK